MSVRSLAVAVLLAALALVAPARAQTAGNVVFSGMQVHEIRLQFSQTAFWDSLTTYYAAGNEQYMAATATLDGVVMPSVGVRLKGNSSYGHPNNKKPIRLSFDEYVGSQRWDGLKGVHLNNNFGDPSFLRERLYYDFCRDIGLPVPRASYAAVYLNDSLYGLYTLVEHVNKDFLQARFGNKNGVHLKAVDAFGQNTTVSDYRWYGAAESNYTARYELKSDLTATSWATLVAVIDAANNSGANLPTALGALVNLDGFYRAMAVDHIFANMDSYSSSGRNFYVYFNTATGKMEWIPWDAGLSFGGFSTGSTTPEQLPLTYSVSTRPLAYNLFNNATTRADYLATTRTVAASFTTARLFPHIDSLVTLIRPYVTADPRKQYTTAQFETNVTSDLTTGGGGGGGRKPGIKSFITARVAFLRSQFPTAGSDEPALADAVLLESAPNPFRQSTQIRYAVATGGRVSLVVYDVLGREVARLVDGEQGAGTYDVAFDAAGLPSGMYVCRLSAGGATRTRTVVLQR